VRKTTTSHLFGFGPACAFIGNSQPQSTKANDCSSQNFLPVLPILPVLPLPLPVPSQGLRRNTTRTSERFECPQSGPLRVFAPPEPSGGAVCRLSGAGWTPSPAPRGRQ